jgi:ketosteroid isomerase-like protein
LKHLGLSVLVLGILLLNVALAADRDPQLLIQADRDFAKATAERGVEGWMAFMAPNAVDLTGEVQVGPDQIRANMTKQFKLPGYKLWWAPTKAEFLGTGDIGYTVGRYEVLYTGGDRKPQARRGTYLTTWQKQKDGSWKVVSDIGSPDASH